MELMRSKGRISWLAVLAGFLLDNILSLIIGGIMLSIEPNIGDGRYFTTSTGIIAGVLLGLSTVLGGFLAGWLAKEDRFLHGFLVGGIGIVMLLLNSLGAAGLTLDMIVLQFLATGLAGVAGYTSRWTPLRQSK